MGGVGGVARFEANRPLAFFHKADISKGINLLLEQVFHHTAHCAGLLLRVVVIPIGVNHHHAAHRNAALAQLLGIEHHVAQATCHGIVEGGGATGRVGFGSQLGRIFQPDVAVQQHNLVVEQDGADQNVIGRGGATHRLEVVLVVGAG